MEPLPPPPINASWLALREELKEFHEKLQALDAATQVRRPPNNLELDVTTYRECLQNRKDFLRLQLSIDNDTDYFKNKLKIWKAQEPRWLEDFQRTRIPVEEWVVSTRNSTDPQKAFAVVINTLNALFKQPHRKAIAEVLLRHPDKNFSLDDVFEELHDVRAPVPEGYKDWSDYQRRNPKPRDIVSQVRRRLQKKGLLKV